MNGTFKLAAFVATGVFGTGASAFAADRYENRQTAYGYQPPVYRAANYCPPTSVNYHVSYQQPAPCAPVVCPPRPCPPQPCAPVAPCAHPQPCTQCGYYGGVSQYPAYNYGPVNTAPVNYVAPTPYQPNPYPYAPYGQNENRENNSKLRGIAERTDFDSRNPITSTRSEQTNNPFFR